jgi:outer membrane protein W
MKINVLLFASLSLALSVLPFTVSTVLAGEAGQIELSAGGSYNHSTYTGTDYEWSRRIGCSVGYYLTDSTELELSFQDSIDRTQITGFEDTTFHDQIYGLTLSQSFFSKTSWFQPYVKVGIGQLDRNASGSYDNGLSPPEIEDNVTGILGAGLKIYLSRTFGLRAEGTSYITSGQTWTSNLSATFGISLYL